MNGKFNLRMDKIRATFCKIRALFFIFKKGQGRPPPSPPPLVPRSNSKCISKTTILNKELLELVFKSGMKPPHPEFGTHWIWTWYFSQGFIQRGTIPYLWKNWNGLFYKCKIINHFYGSDIKTIFSLFALMVRKKYKTF